MKVTPLSQALERAVESGLETSWLGACSEPSVRMLEALLDVDLPPSFREFLIRTGGGLLESSNFSGMINEDPERSSAGTVLGDTLRCRNEFSLPAQLVVVFLDDDDVCWCIDTRSREAVEHPILAYDLYKQRTGPKIADSFAALLSDFIEGLIPKG